MKDLDTLNIEVPAIMPRATQTIDWQIELIKTLGSQGHTYVTSDGVYFDTSTFPHYGQLGGQQSDSKKPGSRIAIGEKKSSTDFALWKLSKPEEKRQMEWPSPWGTGFPGWHIECSAMALHELGPQIDLHTGGIDHIAVHHENEIVQSEAATGKLPFVKYWLHGEFLVLPGKRMGKSEGNSITLNDVIARGIDPLAFRYLCLQTHYRQKLNFTWASLSAAAQGLDRLWQTIAQHPDIPKVGCADFEQRFTEAVNNDLNVPQALAVMQELIKSDYPWSAKSQSLAIFDQVLGLDLNSEAALRHVTPSEPGYESMLEDYETARREKQYAISDRIRKEFEAKGITVEDLPNGTSRLRKK